MILLDRLFAVALCLSRPRRRRSTAASVLLQSGGRPFSRKLATMSGWRGRVPGNHGRLDISTPAVWILGHVRSTQIPDIRVQRIIDLRQEYCWLERGERGDRKNMVKLLLSPNKAEFSLGRGGGTDLDRTYGKSWTVEAEMNQVDISASFTHRVTENYR